jgi:hypothetical protein
MIAGNNDVAYTHTPITREALMNALEMRSFATEKYTLSGQLVILGADTVGFSEDFTPEQVALILISFPLYFIKTYSPDDYSISSYCTRDYATRV